MTESIKQKVQDQFGVAAADYATSDVHAKGESLGRLLALLNPQPAWQALDVATGAGHMALALAPHVARIVASDLTSEMLETTARLARERGLTNVELLRADAEHLPVEDASLDLVSCRLAFHHFPRPDVAAAEMARIVWPGGWLAFTDNVTVADRAAADYYNAYEKLRDPSHYRVDSQAEIVGRFERAGFEILASERLSKEFEFHGWADRQRVSPADKERLLDMMRRIPPVLEPLFAPRWTDGTMYFSLWELVLVGRKR
ncbi:MAG: methyltransferase domain-containing protein [Pirellulales bacterium]|nr:methyltransferase domain-containing protein [Pirellulales bacterium]